MSLGLVLNHISASGNHTETIVSGSSTAARGTLYVSGAAAFGVPSTAGGEVSFTWPGTDTTFFVSGAVATDASATSFGTLGNYDIAVFGGNLQISGSISVDGSIRGGLEAKNAGGAAATPVSTQVAFWTSNLFLSGTDKLRWDDSDLVVGGNLQIQGAATTVSSSNFVAQDSIIGLGFSGSDTFNNVGQRSIIFGKHASASGLLPGITWDGTRIYTVGVPASPSSGSIDMTYGGEGLSGLINIPSHVTGVFTNAALATNYTYGDGSYSKSLVFPVAEAGTVYYPKISGTMDFQIDDGSYLPALHTDMLHDKATHSVWGLSSDVAFRAQGSTSGDANGKWKFYFEDGADTPGKIFGDIDAILSISGLAYFSNSPDGYIFFDGPSSLTTSSTSLEYSTGFDATDVSELATGTLLAFDGGGYGPYYFKVTAAPSVSDTSVSVEYVAGTISGGFGDYSGAYNHRFTAAANWSQSDQGDLILDSTTIHLSASSGDIYLSSSVFRPALDNQTQFGSSDYAWSDLYLGDGAVLNFANSAYNASKVTHSSGKLTSSGSLAYAGSTGGIGTLNYFDSMSGDGQTAFLASSYTYTQATTTINFASGFSATDVTQMASGNVIVLEESGTHYYFLITATPSVSDTTLSVSALGSGNSFGTPLTWTEGTFSFGVDTYYAPMYATSYTAPAESSIGIAGTAWRVLYADNIDLNGNQTTGSFILDADRDSAIGSSGADKIDWFAGNISTSKFFMNTSGLYPTADNSYDLGKSNKRYRNIYTGDVNLQNDRGDWTLIEENDFISFRNNMTGRRYRMVMEDITGMGNYGPGNDGEM